MCATLDPPQIEFRHRVCDVAGLVMWHLTWYVFCDALFHHKSQPSPSITGQQEWWGPCNSRPSRTWMAQPNPHIAQLRFFINNKSAQPSPQERPSPFHDRGPAHYMMIAQMWKFSTILYTGTMTIRFHHREASSTMYKFITYEHLKSSPNKAQIYNYISHIYMVIHKMKFHQLHPVQITIAHLVHLHFTYIG